MQRVAVAQPWAQGVTDEQKKTAQSHLEEGNALFLAQKYKEALEKYQAAIASWDHPAIRFNVVRCLIQLDRPVEASDNLQAALKYGAEPLEEAVYQEALSYQKLLANQIGDLEVSCSQAGAKLTLDGQPLMNCPGKEKRRVSPGTHGIVATKDGFLTKSMQIDVVGGKSKDVDIKLIPLDKAAKVVHKWGTWFPWVVFGGSIAVAGAGIGIEFIAKSDMNSYDQRVASACAVNGCNLNITDKNDPQYDLAQQLNAQKDRAETRDKVANTVIAIGAAGTVAGAVLLFLNRGQTVYEDPKAATATTFNVLPTHDGGAMATLAGHF
jgi:tetratricopeptide (TPR) repeat protein